MNVGELREALAGLPAHWPVTVAVRADGSDGGADTDYLYTLDVQRDNFPTLGNMAVIRIGHSDASAEEEAWLREKRKFPSSSTAAGVKATSFAELAGPTPRGSVSYWQRGCDDAKAGKPYTPPTRDGEHDLANSGYANGYDYAASKAKREAAPSYSDEFSSVGAEPIAGPSTKSDAK